MERDRRASEKFVRLKLTLKDTFRAYLEFTKVVHKMRSQEILVLSLLMYYNWLETPNFKRESDRWKKVFDIDTKALIKEELNLNSNVFQNILTSLRKKGAIYKDGNVNKISKNYMIHIEQDGTSFTLSINFLFRDVQKVSKEA